MNNRLHSVRKAFTLIELLVVMAIISILASIMFPAFASAKDTAKSIVCVSNMKQIGMAINMYLSDYDDQWFGAYMEDQTDPNFPQIPWYGYDNKNAPLFAGFYGRVDQQAGNGYRPGLIDPYVRARQLFRCPSMPSNWQSSYAINWFNTNTPSAYYTSNPGAQGKEFGPAARTTTQMPGGYFSMTGASDSEIEEHANTLVAWEHLARAALCNFLQTPNWEESPPNDVDLITHFHFLHRKGANALWADTHVKRIVYTQLKRRMFATNKSIYDSQ